MKREISNIKSVRGSSVNVFNFWNILFWNYCQKCKKEFVREGGWRYCESGYNSHIRIVCKKCCSTKEEVIQYFKKIDEAFRDSRNNYKLPAQSGYGYKRKKFKKYDKERKKICIDSTKNSG